MEAKLEAALIEARETTIDEQGDLLVHIANDEENQRFLVDSNALSRLSGKWKSLIQELRDAHDDAIGARCTKLTISIKGRPDYHWLLFRIMHGDFECIPEELAESQLFDILSLTEEYQIRLSLLRPWIPMWISTHQRWPGTTGPCDAAGLYNRLWVAWILGEVKKFHELLILLVQEVVPGNGDAELLISGKPLPQSPDIPGLFVVNSISDYLRSERESRVSDLLNVFDKQVYLCETGQTRYCKFAERPDTERSMCDFIVAGSILRGYHNQVVEPAGSSRARRRQSVKVTYDRLKSIVIHTYSCIPVDGTPSPPAGQTHEGRCNPTAGLHEELQMITEMEDLDDCFLQHLTQQARLTGLDSWMWDYV
ncbi:hypothetical protein PG984_007046 [Apiospora sp. TS-2023a]